MRSFHSALQGTFLKHYQDGVLRYTYRGTPCLKSPIDIAIYLRLIWDLKPEMILEVGSKAGGSALLLADISAIYGLNAHIFSIDVAPPKAMADDRITFIEGDVRDLEATFDQLNVKNVPHPWMIIEDSAHSFEGCLAALRFLSKEMIAGDVLAIEDGILDQLGLAGRYDGGPNRAISTFMAEEPGAFEIITELCDMFGPNATYNPNGYLVSADFLSRAFFFDLRGMR